mmetsp:Transcript_16320/g.56993  ORF Transcript_16320/g.56993 Transcript_16320/m.56993 type:complete len:285 (-) Transcript_16320:175-1029(-)
MMMVTTLHDHAGPQLALELALPPLRRGVAPHLAPVHGLFGNVYRHFVLAELTPDDRQLVVVQRPMRMRRELVALEVVVAVGLELDGEAASGPLEVPLGASSVAYQNILHRRELSQKGCLAPILVVALLLRHAVAVHGLARSIELELVGPKVAPFDFDQIALQLPPRRRLELWAVEAPSRPEADGEGPSKPLEVVPTHHVGRLHNNRDAFGGESRASRGRSRPAIRLPVASRRRSSQRRRSSAQAQQQPQRGTSTKGATARRSQIRQRGLHRSSQVRPASERGQA